MPRTLPATQYIRAELVNGSRIAVFSDLAMEKLISFKTKLALGCLEGFQIFFACTMPPLM